MNNNSKINELTEDELDEIAGGGTYSSKGFLRTTAGYSCGHFACKVCGAANEHFHDGLGFDNEGCTIKIRCKDCEWHKALLCTNPLNKKG